ncbi:MAG: polysaccharide biosynthesis protein [Runella slithyformis]|nr:MAG: polysaccharide biosynthesis protein [Runella slithyformis]
MSVLKKLASDTALYGVSTILGRTLNWALVPLHTVIFTRPEQLASNIELYSWVALLNVIYTYGMETAFFRFASRQADAKMTYFNQAVTALILTSLLFSGTLMLFSSQIVGWLDYRGEEMNVVWLALIIAIDAVVAIPFARLRLEKKAKQFVTVKIINILTNVGLNVFFLVVCRDIHQSKYLTTFKPLIDSFYNPTLGPGYIFLANLLANGLFLVLLRNGFRGFRFSWNFAIFKELWQYGYPIFIMGLAGIVNLMTDRWFLRHLLPEGFYAGLSSKDVLSIYGNCYKLSIFMALAIQAFKFAADPFFFSKAEDKNAPSLLALVNKWFIVVCVLIWVGICLNLDTISLLIGKNYRSGTDAVPLLMLANLVLGVFYNVAFWFKLSDKTYFGTLITAIGAVVTVLLNIILIPQLGYMGCAWAFLISSLVMLVLCVWLGQKHYPVNYDWARPIGYVLGGGLLICAAMPIKINNQWLAIPYHLLLCLLFLLVVLVIERQALPLKIKQKLKI